MNWQWHLEQVLVSWIVEGAHDDLVHVIVPHRPRGILEERVEPFPIDALIYELWDDTTLLPDVAGVRLGLPPLTTYAHAVRLVWSIAAGDEFPPQSCSEAARYMPALPPEIMHRRHQAVDATIRTGDERRLSYATSRDDRLAATA